MLIVGAGTLCTHPRLSTVDLGYVEFALHELCFVALLLT